MVDVLVLWDALFADGPMLDLVDYIYISMLEAIRDRRTYPFSFNNICSKLSSAGINFCMKNGEFFSHEEKKIPKTRANANSPLIASPTDTLTRCVSLSG